MYVIKTKISGIYKITNPEGKIYIGKSIDIISRIRNHFNYGKHRVDRLATSFSSFGLENHDFEIIFQCRKEELFFYEWYFIEKYNSLDKGLNNNSPSYPKEMFDKNINESVLKITYNCIFKNDTNKIGRKKIPNAIRLNFLIPAEKEEQVRAYINNIQKAAIYKETLIQNTSVSTQKNKAKNI